MVANLGDQPGVEKRRTYHLARDRPRGGSTIPGSGWGELDYQDVMVCADAACERFGWVDPDRLERAILRYIQANFAYIDPLSRHILNDCTEPSLVLYRHQVSLTGL